MAQLSAIHVDRQLSANLEVISDPSRDGAENLLFAIIGHREGRYAVDFAMIDTCIGKRAEGSFDGDPQFTAAAALT